MTRKTETHFENLPSHFTDRNPYASRIAITTGSVAKAPPPGPSFFPCEQGWKRSGKVQENYNKLSREAVILVNTMVSLHTFSCKVTVFIIFTRLVSVLLYSVPAVAAWKKKSHPGTRQIFCPCCKNCHLWLVKIENPVFILMSSPVSYS